MDRPPPPLPPAEPLPDTAAPARNFTLTIDDRLRAFAQGAPGYMRRRRRIEDLEARLLRILAAAEAPREAAEAADFIEDLAAINDLIDKHNRYYPIEANLPIDVRSGLLLDRGKPWRPLTRVTVEDLLARGPEGPRGF